MAMNLASIFLHLYLPLLTQETAIMVSSFVYGMKAGISNLTLAGINTAAVFTDLVLFFLPSYILSRRLHRRLAALLPGHFEKGGRAVRRFGDFRAAVLLGFVMPSIAAMIVVGLLRLSFWRALAGLLLGSVAYVALPLAIASSLASTLPSFLLPTLQWMPPALAALFLLVAAARWLLGRSRTPIGTWSGSSKDGRAQRNAPGREGISA